MGDQFYQDENVHGIGPGSRRDFSQFGWPYCELLQVFLDSSYLEGSSNVPEVH
jgi:hypothetical protein